MQMQCWRKWLLAGRRGRSVTDILILRKDDRHISDDYTKPVSGRFLFLSAGELVQVDSALTGESDVEHGEGHLFRIRGCTKSICIPRLLAPTGSERRTGLVETLGAILLGTRHPAPTATVRADCLVLANLRASAPSQSRP